ncbi:phosphoenolpyruvate--protein phosphotransferase [Pseudoflavonifractor sp. CLA-AP-H29]|uniref:Phosphoenolpyruvate-protein phosphotransferase n=1 Tax=Pseudoflavonifractor intestinihominis TaxID=3133171 RepID=A0ABV1E8N0_9FIRM
MREYTGTTASPGVAIGPAMVFTHTLVQAKERSISPGEAAAELALFDAALARAEEELRSIQTGGEGAGIFAAHLAILSDEEMNQEIRAGIQSLGRCAGWAVQAVYREFAGLLRDVDDPLIRERAADMDDVGQRLLRCILGLPPCSLAQIDRPSIVVAEDLYPSDTVTMDRKNVLGILTQRGGVTSHTAILARSLGIPAVVGVPEVLSQVEPGTPLILDAVHGKVIAAADRDTLLRYQAMRERVLSQAQAAQRYRSAPAVTRDGVRIHVDLNIGGVTAQALDGLDCVDGVGLFRTEFLYMQSQTLPDEDTQFTSYRAALEALDGRPLVLRTLDIGGDKQLPYLELPREDNPFLGRRALRLCLAEPELFRIQLRAALRASVFGQLRIMFPMVGSLDDFRAAKATVVKAQEELEREGIPFRRDVALGVMIEIPAAAMIADLLAREADFASIGTNDLCQYLNAADRLEPGAAPYYQSYHPAMFRLIRDVAVAFTAQGKDLCVCGELGGDCAFASALIGLGLRHLSMSASAVAGIKQLVAVLTIPEAQEAARQALSTSTAAQAEEYLRAFAARRTGGEHFV